MQFSVGVEYSLHCLLYMVDLPKGQTVGIKELAQFQGVSESYLSKVYTKMKKAGIVRSITGVKGGYELARSPYEISFWDVIESIEGTSSIFQCAEIRQNSILVDKENLPDSYTKCPCLIKVVMTEAENQMKKYLVDKSIGWLHEQVKGKVGKDEWDETVDWFKENKK